MCKKKKKNNKKPRKHPNQPWFNDECESERNIYLDFKNSFSFTYDKKLYEKNQAEIAKACNKYKQFIKKRKKEYYSELHDTLRQLRSNDAREYWQILNPNKKK